MPAVHSHCLLSGGVVAPVLIQVFWLFAGFIYVWIVVPGQGHTIWYKELKPQLHKLIRILQVSQIHLGGIISATLSIAAAEILTQIVILSLVHMSWKQKN